MKKASQKTGNAGQAATPGPRRSTIDRPASDRRIAIVSTRASAAQVVTNQGITKRSVKARAGARAPSTKSRVSNRTARMPSVAANAMRRGTKSEGPRAFCDSATRERKAGG